ncbi:hypothetical protein ABZ016_05325 [Streptomyces sp. NPDC006372]|uniref:hypothetical protein n=1 Tax=Streptomyces sp. NPDC006372 TaxID=3155599 RepID=UPI0033AA89C6
MTTRVYIAGSDWDRIAVVNPELVSARIDHSFRHSADSVGEGTGAGGGSIDIVSVTVTLALVPFLQAVTGALGGKVADFLSAQAPKKVVDLLRRRREETASLVGARNFDYVLQVSDTNIRIRLPRDPVETAEAVQVLLGVTFEQFGSQRVGISWDGSRKAWEAWVTGDAEVTLWRWDPDGREWKPVRPQSCSAS